MFSATARICCHAYTFGKRRFAEFLLFILLVVVIFKFPAYPQISLDPSWKMAIGKCFSDGLQFGRDVVFNYGPLGFLMGNLYSGSHFRSLILWQLIAAVIFSAVIVWNARTMRGLSRGGYFLFFLIFGAIYPDALYMIVIMLLGMELVRRSGCGWRISTGFIAVFLALLGMMKFTNLMLCLIVVCIACAHGIWSRHATGAAKLAGFFFGGWVVLWILCRQNPLNIPAYLHGSWEVSQGWQDAMGTPTPPETLWKGVVVAILLAAYLLVYFFSHREKSRALASSACLGAFLFLDWKHSFVRPDEHTLVFFISALVPVVAFPALMDDAPSFRGLQRILLLAAGVFSIWGMYDVTQSEETAPPCVRNALATLEDTVWENVSDVIHWKTFASSYDKALEDERAKFDLPQVRSAVGSATLAVIGYEQAIAFYNRLNYRPSPALQNISTYNDYLARIDYDFFASSRAPDFALMKVQTIDDRLPALDDSTLLRLLPSRYEYLFSEKGYSLWKHRAVPLPEPVPSFLRAETPALNAPLEFGQLAQKRLWVRIDLKPTLLGRLRNFFYKPAFVNLVLVDGAGESHLFNMPVTQARIGFILNPLIENNADYIRFASGYDGIGIRSLDLQVAPEDLRFFEKSARVEFYELTGG
jgi:hypothetical protein